MPRAFGWRAGTTRPTPCAWQAPRLRCPFPAIGSSLDSAVSAGVGRRLERKGEGRGVVVYDDYGHHPTAIRETLAALRQLEPGRRIWAVYEPLTYHRTAAMLDQFAEVLATADARGRCRYLGQPRSGHDHHVGRGAGRGHCPAQAGADGGRPGVGRTDGRVAGKRGPSPATPSWSWAAAGATGSRSCCWRRSPAEASTQQEPADLPGRKLGPGAAQSLHPAGARFGPLAAALAVRGAAARPCGPGGARDHREGQWQASPHSTW